MRRNRLAGALALIILSLACLVIAILWPPRCSRSSAIGGPDPSNRNFCQLRSNEGTFRPPARCGYAIGATNPELRMSSIPLDLQRRFEQRWAARFLPKPPNQPEKHQLERQGRQPALGKGQRKIDQLKQPTAFRPAPAA
jgi:hypothetical protein